MSSLLQPGRALGLFVAVAVMLVGAVVACAIMVYLTEQGSLRLIGAFLVLGASCIAAVVLYLLVMKLCRAARRAFLGAVVGIVLMGALLGSMVYPGKITYSRFGLTVYGLVPVPVLDVTVGPSGMLWFRDKSHYVSVDEIKTLVTPEVEVVVIGIGWRSAVKVDPAIRSLDGPEVLVLPTPDAFEAFNRSVTEGRKAVLLAQPTC